MMMMIMVVVVVEVLIGSLSNYDDHHNDDFKKTIGLMIKTTRFSVHFFDVHCTTITWSLLIWRFIEDVDNDEFSFLFLNLNKIL